MGKAEQFKKKYDKAQADYQKMQDKMSKLETDMALYWAEYITALKVDYNLSDEEFEARLKRPLDTDTSHGGHGHV